MDYKEAMQYIAGIQQNYGSDYSLREVKELSRRVGSPEKKIKAVHIAGTNGKGSVGGYLSNILAQAGYTVGRYLSPTLLGYRERIQKVYAVSGRLQAEWIAEEELAEMLTRLKEECEAMCADGFSQPTAFEIETVMAFLVFWKQKADVAVVEAGMGGRTDATNIIEHPLLCIFTSISMDHMQFLGSTLEQIAAEKYGIVKRGTQVVARKQEAGRQLLEEVCRKKGAGLSFVSVEGISIQKAELHRTEFLYGGSEYTLSQGGSCQPENAAIALEAARKLAKTGLFRITGEQIAQGLSASRFCGRFDIISENPFVLADGAHNEDAAKKLCESLSLYFPEERFVFVMGVFRDKEYRKMACMLLPLAEKIYTVTAPGSRGLDSNILCREIRMLAGRTSILSCGTVENALSQALSDAKKTKVVVCGSLSLVQDVYHYFTMKAPTSGWTV